MVPPHLHIRSTTSSTTATTPSFPLCTGSQKQVVIQVVVVQRWSINGIPTKPTYPLHPICCNFTKTRCTVPLKSLGSRRLCFTLSPLL